MIQIDFIVKSSPITQRGVNLSPVCGLGDKNIEKIGITKENIFPKTIILPYLSRFQSAFQIFYNCNYMITIQLGYFPMQHIYIIDYQRPFILIGTTSVLTNTQNVGTNANRCISWYCIYVLYRLFSVLLWNVRYQIQCIE